MSDNPNLIEVGVDPDESGFNALNQNIAGVAQGLGALGEKGNASVDALNDKMIQFRARAAEARAEAAALAQSISGIWDDTEQPLQALDEKVVNITKDTKAATDEVIQLATAAKNIQVSGGDGESVSGAGGGSLYGVGRAFSAGGALGRRLGSPEAGAALTEAGEFLRFGQGVQRLVEYLTPASEAIEKTGGLIGTLATGLDAAGVPLAGLVTVFTPLAALAAVIAIQFHNLQEAMKPLDEALKEAIQRNTKYYEVVHSGATRTDVVKDIDDANKKVVASEKALADQTKQLDAAFVQASDPNSALNKFIEVILGPITGSVVKGDLGGRITTAISPESKDLQESVDKLKTAFTGGKAAIEAYNDALKSREITDNSLSLRLREEQDKRIAQAAQYIQFTQLSSKAAEDQIGMLAIDRQSREEANTALQKQNDRLSSSSAAFKANQDAIAENQKQIDADTQQMKALSDAEVNVILKREAEAAAIQAQDEAIQRHIGYMSKEADLTETGTPDQLESFKRTLRNQIAGQQYELDQREARNAPEDAPKIVALKASIKDAQDELGRLDQVVAPIVETNKALKDMAKAADDFNKASEGVKNNLQIQSNSARQREADAEKQYTQGSLQDTEARYQIALKESRAETDLAQKTSDAITDILTKRDQKISQIGLDYSRQIQDDQAKAAQDDAKIQTEAARQQEADLVDHLNKIAEINRNAYASEKQDLYDRNFLQFAKDELKRQTDIANEDSGAQQKTAKLAIHLKQQEEDLGTSLKNQAEQQAVAYERKLQDAATAADNEIAQQKVNERRKEQSLQQSEFDQINDLNHSEQYKIQVLREGLTAELSLYQQQSRERIAIAAQERDAIVSQSQAALNQIQSFQQQQAIVNSTQAIYPWQAAPLSVSQQNNFNTPVNVTQAAGILSSPFDLASQLENFVTGVLR